MDSGEVRLMTMLNSYMYGDECSNKPLPKKNLVEALMEEIDSDPGLVDDEFADEERNWLWQEIGLHSMRELFKLLVEFAETNFEWVAKLKS